MGIRCKVLHPFEQLSRCAIFSMKSCEQEHPNTILRHYFVQPNKVFNTCFCPSRCQHSISADNVSQLSWTAGQNRLWTEVCWTDQLSIAVRADGNRRTIWSADRLNQLRSTQQISTDLACLRLVFTYIGISGARGLWTRWNNYWKRQFCLGVCETC